MSVATIFSGLILAAMKTHHHFSGRHEVSIYSLVTEV